MQALRDGDFDVAVNGEMIRVSLRPSNNFITKERTRLDEIPPNEEGLPERVKEWTRDDWKDHGRTREADEPIGLTRRIQRWNLRYIASFKGIQCIVNERARIGRGGHRQYSSTAYERPRDFLRSSTRQDRRQFQTRRDYETEAELEAVFSQVTGTRFEISPPILSRIVPPNPSKADPKQRLPLFDSQSLLHRRKAALQAQLKRASELFSNPQDDGTEVFRDETELKDGISELEVESFAGSESAILSTTNSTEHGMDAESSITTRSNKASAISLPLDAEPQTDESGKISEEKWEILNKNAPLVKQLTRFAFWHPKRVNRYPPDSRTRPGQAKIKEFGADRVLNLKPGTLSQVIAETRRKYQDQPDQHYNPLKFPPQISKLQRDVTGSDVPVYFSNRTRWPTDSTTTYGKLVPLYCKPRSRHISGPNSQTLKNHLVTSRSSYSKGSGEGASR